MKNKISTDEIIHIKKSIDSIRRGNASSIKSNLEKTSFHIYKIKNIIRIDLRDL